MRCACIDVGSNTTRLLVAETVPGGFREVTNERAFTLIGRSLGCGAEIPAEKVRETAVIVAEQAELARELGSERLRAVATAAIRRAANARELVDAVSERAGLPLDVLAAEEEAGLAFRGATRALGGDGAGTLAVVDVGGGSTEIAIGTASGRVASATSFAIGSSQLAQAHLRGDPPGAEEIEAVRAEVAATLGAFRPGTPDRAVAVGGSASSLACLAGDVLDAEAIERALGLLCEAPAADVAERYRLEPVRVRLLPAGLLVLEELARRLRRPLQVCRGGLREGVILEMIGNPN